MSEVDGIEGSPVRHHRINETVVSRHTIILIERFPAGGVVYRKARIIDRNEDGGDAHKKHACRQRRQPLFTLEPEKSENRVQERQVVFHEIAHHQEIGRHADSQYRQYGQYLGYSQAEEKRQQKGLQQVVDDMGKGKTGTSACRGTDAESVANGGHIVENEAHHIGYRIGQQRLQPYRQQQIHPVLYGGGHDTHLRKADHFDPLAFSEKVFQIFHRHIPTFLYHPCCRQTPTPGNARGEE